MLEFVLLFLVIKQTGFLLIAIGLDKNCPIFTQTSKNPSLILFMGFDNFFLLIIDTLPCRIVRPGLLLGRVFKKLYFGATVTYRAMEICQIHLDKL